MEIELLRPSKLGDWATCAKKMRYLAANSPGGRGPHISSWIGTAVHRRLDNEIFEPVPFGALYDTTTPTVHVARVQVDRISSMIRELCVRHGLTPKDTEVPVSDGEHGGTLDVVFSRDLFDRTSVIGDIKTGKRIPNGVWLQLGSYFDMAVHPDSTITEEFREVCVVHVPRTPLNEPQPGRIEFRDGAECGREAALWYRMIGRLIEDDSDIREFPASPGIACHSCPMTADECAVRINQKE